MNLDELNLSLRRMTLTVVVFAGVATVVTISSMYALFRAQVALERATYERPVMVVPGAVAGEYLAGLSTENLKGVGRYVGQLGTSFTTANFKSRMDELVSFADASYLPSLTNDVRALEAEMLAQAQGRFFLPEEKSEKLVVISPNLFEYQAVGTWAFTASGLSLSQDQGTITVRFKLGQPAEKNKYGLKIVKFAAVRSKGAL